MIKQALLSVSDKTGVVELARVLVERGIRILSTGGTAKLLADNGVAVTEVADYTGFPEMLDGRVKTLHPKIHGGVLAKRDSSEHMKALKEHGIETIDLLVVNLYPFARTVAKPGCSFDEAIENIDIGGPTMLRAAAKNHHDVAVVVDPADYSMVLTEMQANGGEVTRATKLLLAKKVFAHTAQYDGAITNYLTALSPDRSRGKLFPQTLNLHFEKVQELRYGENPHQSAAFYRDVETVPGSLASYTQLQGKELSYNNIADADAAWECLKTFDEPCCVIVKHANPCGVAVGATLLEAYEKALKTDPTSAFGGIIAFNRSLDGATAAAVVKQFVEVVIAPAVSAEAHTIFTAKQNVRLLQVRLASAQSGSASAAPGSSADPTGKGFLPPSASAGEGSAARASGVKKSGARAEEETPGSMDYKRIGGGLLVQSPDSKNVQLTEFKVVTKKQPTPQQLADLVFAWRVAKFVKSNAIVFCAGGMTLGVGAGQMSRIDSARIASIKAHNAGLSLAGSAVASDAFFPFRDGLDVVVDAGATSVVHPGGSMRDEEVIAAADERGIAMVVTGTRHFRH